MWVFRLRVSKHIVSSVHTWWLQPFFPSRRPALSWILATYWHKAPSTLGCEPRKVKCFWSKSIYLQSKRQQRFQDVSEFLPGFCFAVPCRIACSGLCRMSDFGKESSKSMAEVSRLSALLVAEVSRLSALLEASGLAIQPSSIPSRLRRLEQISYVESHSVRDLDRLIPKFFICW